MEIGSCGRREDIRRWWQRRSSSRPELAKEGHLSLNNVNRIENGLQAPRPMTVRKIAKVLKVDPAVLWGQDTSDDGQAAGV